MSIKVTVKGNPVSIKRGKMVTVDCNKSKAEFEQRRLIRLEQVRQQSKDIAENIRNKVRTEQTKQRSDLEKDGEIKLKQWQARKLLELQNQYQETLEEIGLGHKQAKEVDQEEEILAEMKESNDQLVKERGEIAAERLQIEKNEANLRKALPLQRKKLSKDMEKARSFKVAGRARNETSPFKKRKTISSADSDSENRVPKLAVLETSSRDSYTEQTGEEWTKSTRKVVHKVSTEQQTSPGEVRTTDKSAQTLPQMESVTIDESPPYTKISERIKRRVLLNRESCSCDIVENEHFRQPSPLQLPTVDETCICCQCHTDSERDPVKVDDEPEDKRIPYKPKITLRSLKEGSNVTTNPSNEPKDKRIPNKPKITLQSQKEGPNVVTKPSDDPRDKRIPNKPNITLRSLKEGPNVATKPARATPTTGGDVKYYDHHNRYSKVGPSTSRLEKIDDESLVVSPDVVSENEYKEKMRQRDIEAHIRGQKALEKERIHRDYKELLKKLPALQKQERICEINGDKPEYHMSDTRLKEWERQRQNRLDNAYEVLFERGQPAVVTLPKTQSKDVQPSLNVANWDVDFTPDPAQRTRNRNDELLALLESLKTHKNELLKEVQDLPQSDENKRKRVRDHSSSSTSNIVEPDNKPSSSTITKSENTIPSPRKKPKLKKSKRKVLVLQNISTQTTPKPETGTEAPSAMQSQQQVTECKNDHFPCSCSDDNERMCEIVIKIKENDKPRVTVNQASKGIHVVTTHEMSGSEISKIGDTVDTKTKESSVKSKPSKSERSGVPWRHHLSQTSSLSTASTSYWSPPDFAKRPTSTDDKPRQFPTRTVQKISPPVPGDFTKSSFESTRTLDAKLLTYIRKLLNMSRASVDDLTASAASEVSTPTQSIIEMPSNNPLNQLRNVIKYFNIDPTDLRRQLSLSAGSSNIHYNTSRSPSVSSANDNATSSAKITKDNSVGQFKDTTKETVAKYADIAESCSKKISNLTAMIEKVRAEKKKILQSPPTSISDSGQDYTTKYLDLPGIKHDSTKSSDESDQKVLEIDYSYAERLKQLTPEQLEIEKRKNISQDASVSTEEELLVRLRRLLQESQPKTPSPNNEVMADIPDKPSFVPLLDIQKLPKFEATSLDVGTLNKKRPPPSKGMRVIQAVPHELSTIIEADSLMSTKLEPSVSKLDEPAKGQESPSSGRSSNGVPDILAEIPSPTAAPQTQTDSKPLSLSNSSSSDKSDLETIEAMLHSIGMEWAIPTLRKTREALAMVSSSSSSDKSKKSSDVSFREFLARHLSSSTHKSTDNTPTSVMSDFQEISGIQYRRTSTPVQRSEEKSLEKDSRPAMFADSDLSSVREEGGKKEAERFFDLNEESISKTT